MSTHAGARKAAELYNMVPNLVWSVLHLTPVFVFCYTQMPLPATGLILTASLVAAVLPLRCYRLIQLGNDAAVYRKAGILLVRKFSQDGDIINALLRKRFPQYKVIRRKAGYAGYLQRANMFERFHAAVLAAMLAFAVYALWKGQYGWALLMTLNNMLYNVYPIWLQQYNRLRLTAIVKRKTPQA